MGLLTKIGSALSGSVVDSVADIADRFIQTADEKAAFTVEVQREVTKRVEQHMLTARSEIDGKVAVMVAELEHGDAYTKRARPTLIYFGMLVIFWNYCIRPFVGEAPVDLPAEYWMAWGGAVGVYVIGRSAEKAGKGNKLSGLVTGSDQPRIDL